MKKKTNYSNMKTGGRATSILCKENDPKLIPNGYIMNLNSLESSFCYAVKLEWVSSLINTCWEFYAKSYLHLNYPPWSLKYLKRYNFWTISFQHVVFWYTEIFLSKHFMKYSFRVISWNTFLKYFYFSIQHSLRMFLMNKKLCL